MPVHLTILIMAENVAAVVFPPPTARNPVDQALDFIQFGPEGNCNEISDEGGLETFEDFFGCTVSDV